MDSIYRIRVHDCDGPGLVYEEAQWGILDDTTEYLPGQDRVCVLSHPVKPGVFLIISMAYCTCKLYTIA